MKKIFCVHIIYLLSIYLISLSNYPTIDLYICIYPYIYLSYLSFYLLSIYLGTSEKKRKLADEAYDLTDDNFTHDDDVPDKLSTFRYIREGIRKLRTCIPLSAEKIVFPNRIIFRMH